MPRGNGAAGAVFAQVQVAGTLPEMAVDHCGDVDLRGIVVLGIPNLALRRGAVQKEHFMHHIPA